MRGLIDKKIIIGGLDNAGKTSFLIALRHKYDFYERVKKLKPTIKVDYSSFEFIKHLISIWDMGGQSKYREIYINNPDIYFAEVDYMYYIIDIQDELKLQDSIHYLGELLKIYREMQYTNDIVICLNKYDPKYKYNEEFFDRSEMIKRLIENENKDLSFKFFNTSIYDISSLSKAMSYSLAKLLNLEEINAHLDNFIKNYQASYTILYTNTGLIIADAYKDTMDSRDFDDIISSKIADDLEFFQRLADENVGIDGRLTYIGNLMEYVKKYEVTTNEKKIYFYLGVSAPPESLKTIKDELDDFTNVLSAAFSE